MHFWKNFSRKCVSLLYSFIQVDKRALDNEKIRGFRDLFVNCQQRHLIFISFSYSPYATANPIFNVPIDLIFLSIYPNDGRISPQLVWPYFLPLHNKMDWSKTVLRHFQGTLGSFSKSARFYDEN